eukprot:3937583-Rhodomonas_salina.1
MIFFLTVTISFLSSIQASPLSSSPPSSPSSAALSACAALCECWSQDLALTHILSALSLCECVCVVREELRREKGGQRVKREGGGMTQSLEWGKELAVAVHFWQWGSQCWLWWSWLW